MPSAAWKRAKGWPGWVLLAVVVAGLLFVGITTDNSPPTAEERVEAISKRLACPICDGESVFESRNNASANIRNEIRQQVAAGERTNDEIITFFVQRESRLLLVPKASGLDALVWALPAFAAVCAIAGLVVAFRRWGRAADTVPSDDDRQLVAAARAADEP
jgi:cytochrome c-type biogenesis protein CcmH